MAQLMKWLLGIDPQIWYITVGAALWLATYLLRRFLPTVWVVVIAKNPSVEKLWLTAIGALLSAAPAIGKPLGEFVEKMLVGAVLNSINAQGIHAMLKDLPIPYTGAQKQVAAAFVKRNTPPGGVSSLDRPPPDTSSSVTPLDRPSPPGPKT